MHNPSLHVLVVESQALIAVEIEHILTETLGCRVTVTTLARCDAALANGRYDVVLMEATASGAMNLARAEQITAAGAASVFLSSYEDFAHEETATAGFPVIGKPFDPADLVAAVLAAAGR